MKHTTQAYRCFLRAWGGLHPCAASARQVRLQGLEFLVEAEEAAKAFRQGTLPQELLNQSTSSSSSSSFPAAVLLGKWRADRRRAPCLELDPPEVWADVGMLREWCLLQRPSSSSSSSSLSAAAAAIRGGGGGGGGSMEEEEEMEDEAAAAFRGGWVGRLLSRSCM